MFKTNIAILILLLSSYGKVEAQKTAISMQDFNACFPLRNKFYTYTAFAKAISEMTAIKIKIEERDGWIYKITRTDKRTRKQIIIRQDKDWNETWAKQKPYTVVEVDYGDFCSNKNGKTNKMELAALFAHMAHETRNGVDGKFNDGLMLIKESDPHSDYIVPNLVYPAAAGKKYYGRGPIQLSYNENYGFASDCIFGTQDILLKNPELVSSNAVIAFETAIYFWMTPQSPKPSAHDVMTGKWVPSATEKQKGYKPGFGLTINIINGGLECNKSENLPQMKDRIGFYQYFLNQFKIDDNNCACSCAQMPPYSG